MGILMNCNFNLANMQRQRLLEQARVVSSLMRRVTSAKLQKSRLCTHSAWGMQNKLMTPKIVGWTCRRDQSLRCTFAHGSKQPANGRIGTGKTLRLILARQPIIARFGLITAASSAWGASGHGTRSLSKQLRCSHAIAGKHAVRIIRVVR